MIVNKNLYCLKNVCQPGRKVIEHAMKERNELVNRRICRVGHYQDRFLGYGRYELTISVD